MLRQPPTTTSPEQRNGRPVQTPQAPAGADTGNPVSARATRLGHTGYWLRWTLGIIALIALLNAVGVLVLFVASLLPVALLIYAMGLATLLGLIAVVVSPPVYAPPTTARLAAEDWLRNNS